MDQLLNQFIEINKLIENENESRSKTKKPLLNARFYLEWKQFSKEFIDSNCQIQIVRSDNQTLLDDIDLKKQEIAGQEEEQDRKLQVGREFSRRIKMLRVRQRN